MEKILDKLDIIQKEVHAIDVRLARLETALSIRTGIIAFVAGMIPAMLAIWAG